MAPLPPGGTVAVTGSAGYVGGWITRVLLDRGHRVRACVRNAGDPKADFLRRFPGFYTGRLTLHSCDMTRQGAFDDAFAGCDAVVHAAADPDVPLEAREEEYQSNCRLILESIGRSPTVTRVIYTSSAAAIAGDDDILEYRSRPVIDESRYPRTCDGGSRPNGYVLGKLACEKLFFAAASASRGRWEAIVANPSDNIGPVLSKHQVDSRLAWKPWHTTITNILEGRDFPQNYGLRPWWTVDVRDTAEAHVRLLESANPVGGHRYFVCSTESIAVDDLGRFIAELLPEAGLDPSTAPQALEAGGLPEEEVRRVWAACHLRNDKVREETGMVFRPLSMSLRDCVESLIAVAGIRPRLRTPEPEAKRPRAS